MSSWLNTVIIPCLNEEMTIVQVIEEIRKNSPESRIVVVDNGSEDQTQKVAKAVGAEVLFCPERGKAKAVRLALHQFPSDSYTIVDGDQTYDLSHLQEMVQRIQLGAHMVVGKRNLNTGNGAFPRFHAFGNFFFSSLITLLFGTRITDALSGLRVMSSEFVQNAPLTVEGFEMEAFYTLQAVVRKYSVYEVDITYRIRPKGSSSKLRTFHDGFHILVCILKAFKNRQRIRSSVPATKKAA